MDVYWPSAFENLDKQLTSQDEYIIVSETWARVLERGSCTRFLTCGLVDEEKYSAVTAEQELGYKVSSSDPHPCVTPGVGSEYEPHFWIHGGPAIPENIEPLVLSWQSNNRTVHWPDPGFLMTYGLTPRIAKQDETIYWDDPTYPAHDIVIVEPVSLYMSINNRSVGSVRVRKDFLQDYASLRQKSIVCVFYEQWILAQNEESKHQLGDDTYKEWRKIGAYYRLQHSVGTTSEYCLNIWGHRLIIRPGEYPVSEGANDYGELVWPGVSNVVNGENYRGLGLDEVCVNDDVLGRFEGRDEYSIQPESGSVSFGGQWSAEFCDRYGRDFIRLELKKLYEGNPPYIVRHYQQHAVAAPEGDPQMLLNAPNVGRRARRIVYAFVSLGEVLAGLCGQILNKNLISKSTVGMSRADLDYYGWWEADYVEPICRHAPSSMTQDGFVRRCKDLAKLIIEGLEQSPLRQSLDALHISEAKKDGWKSIKCLSHLIDLSRYAHGAGLSLLNDSETVAGEFTGPSEPMPCARLFALNALRQLDTHRSGSTRDENLQRGLQAFGVDPATTASGFGDAFDAVYDGIAEELEDLASGFNL